MIQPTIKPTHAASIHFDQPLSQPIELPCGHTLKNRIIKAAMTEGLADAQDHATDRHRHLYQRWAKGGASVLISGNIMVDRRYLERAGNVVVENDTGMDALQRWVEAVHQCDSQLWAQISHPGRQCPRLVNRRPIAPSPVQLKMIGNFGKPRAATSTDIDDIIQRFARTAQICQSAGFDGIQIHGAHGYLISQFLSPVTNRRNDQWGGSLENRARLLLSIIDAVREAVGPRYPVSLKLNSTDFQQGGFSLEESVQVVQWLNDRTLDLLEISGGTYEQLVFFKNQSPSNIRASTHRREAYFLEYAKSIKAVAKMPVMVTGGFRSQQGMMDAINDHHTDLIGLGRPFCVAPDFPTKMMHNELDALPINEEHLILGQGFWGPNSTSKSLQALNNQSQAAWYFRQIEFLADGMEPDESYSPRRALVKHLSWDACRAIRRKFSK